MNRRYMIYAQAKDGSYQLLVSYSVRETAVFLAKRYGRYRHVYVFDSEALDFVSLA